MKKEDGEEEKNKCHHPHRFNVLATESEQWNSGTGSQAVYVKDFKYKTEDGEKNAIILTGEKKNAIILTGSTSLLQKVNSGIVECELSPD